MTELIEQKQQESGETAQVRRSRSGFWFGMIVLLIMFSIAGIGSYLFIQLRDEQKTSSEKEDEHLAELTKQITSYQNQLENLTRELAEKDRHFNDFNKRLDDFTQLHTEKLNSTHKEMSESVQHLERQLGKSRGDWLIADAEYLLSVAGERLHLMNDVNTTREALEAADQRLRESGDSAVFKVREQIVKDLIILKSVQMPDTVGLYSQLQALQNEVDSLTLRLPYINKPIANNSKNENEGFLGALSNAITIHYNEQPINEILTPEEAQFIHEQLRVKLEMVKIALVQHNDSLFQSSLKDAKAWVSQQFAQNETTTHFVDELNKLTAISLQGHFPDISTSLKMLRDITKLRIESDQSPVSNTETKTIETPTPSITFSQPTQETP